MKKIAALICAMALVVPSTVNIAFAQTSTTTVDAKVAQIQALTEQIKALQAQIEQLKKQQNEVKQSVKGDVAALLKGLKEGNEGEQVKILQTLLALDSAIYPEGKVTGFFGPATKRALRKFQNKHGLEGVGFVGPKTYALLLKVYQETQNQGDTTISPELAQEIATFVNSVASTTSASTTTPCIRPSFEDGDGARIMSVGNLYFYKKGKHRVLITPHMRFEKDGKHREIIFCDGRDHGTTPPPTTDTTAPTISAVGTNPSSHQIVVTWTTNESATGKVYYATTSPAVAGTALVASQTGMSTTHTVTLTGLNATTTYHLFVVSADARGNTATSSQYAVTTTVAADTTAPTISAVSSSGVSTSSATVTWTTNEAATSKVYYSTTTPVSVATAAQSSDATLVTSHSRTLTGLTPSSTYYYIVVSSDAAGNTATSSETTFATGAVDATAPTLSAITVTPASTTATVMWTTNEAATSKAYFSTTTPVSTATATNVTDATRVTSHTLNLTGLTASTTYYLLLESRDAANNMGTSTELTFTTAL